MDKKSAHMDPQAMAELIRRYFAGELDDAAMHALEKQSLADPFLAEALEGFEQHPADQRASLASLEARLQQRLAGEEAVVPSSVAAAGPPETPVVKMRRFDYRWAAAAAVLLLVAAGGYQWLHQDHNSAKTTIAQEVPNHVDSTRVIPPAPAPASIVPTPTTSDSSLAAVAAAPALKKPAAPAPAIAKAQRSTWADSAPAAPKAYFDGGGTPGATTPSPRMAMAREVARERTDTVTNSYPDAAPAPDATMAFKKRALLPAKQVAGLQIAGSTPGNSNADSLIIGFDKNVANGLAVKGRVVDEKGTPLPGVVVRYKGAPTAVQTNMDGTFSLPANGSDARRVELQYVGFNKIDTLLYASNDVKNLTLKQDAQGLNDVVVVGYSTGASSSDALAGYEAPRPEAGYDSLQRYLNKSLQVTGAPHTKMRIVFTVTPAGKLENFRILNGVSDFVDQQVIELLKEGPAWKPASDARPTKVRLAVKVPAPKK